MALCMGIETSRLWTLRSTLSHTRDDLRIPGGFGEPSLSNGNTSPGSEIDA